MGIILKSFCDQNRERQQQSVMATNDNQRAWSMTTLIRIVNWYEKIRERANVQEPMELINAAKNEGIIFGIPFERKTNINKLMSDIFESKNDEWKTPIEHELMLMERNRLRQEFGMKSQAVYQAAESAKRLMGTKETIYINELMQNIKEKVQSAMISIRKNTIENIKIEAEMEMAVKHTFTDFFKQIMEGTTDKLAEVKSNPVRENADNMQNMMQNAKQGEEKMVNSKRMSSRSTQTPQKSIDVKLQENAQKSNDVKLQENANKENECERDTKGTKGQDQWNTAKKIPIGEQEWNGFMSDFEQLPWQEELQNIQFTQESQPLQQQNDQNVFNGISSNEKDNVNMKRKVSKVNMNEAGVPKRSRWD